MKSISTNLWQPFAKYHRLMLVILLVGGQILVSWGQTREVTPQNQIEPSPNAYSMAKYGFMSSDKYTGAHTFALPLHTIDFEGLRIPITLAYSQNGLRPSEEASWVGLGWALSSNAQITRKINGVDDFLMDAKNVGWVNMHNYAFDVEDPTILDSDLYEIMFLTNKTLDAEPDIYVINLFGRNIKFLFQRKTLNGGVLKAETLNVQGFKITYDESLKNFEIIDDRGFKYLFKTKEVSFTGSGAVSRTEPDELYRFDALYDEDFNKKGTITAWYVDQIIAPNGRVLDFNYRVGQERTMTQPAINSSVGALLCAGTITHYTTAAKIEWNRTATDHVYLTSIRNPQTEEELKFVLRDREDLAKSTISYVSYRDEPAKKLSEIQMLFKNELKGKIKLFHSYFNADKQNDPLKDRYLRLKLDGVDILGKTYQFEYEQPNALPIKTTKSLDMWGYYNGKPNLVSYPTFSAIYNCETSGETPELKFAGIKGANKEADYNFSKLGLLNKVSYPTKGYTVFSYERHLAKVVGNNYFSTSEIVPSYEETFENNYSAQNPNPKEFTFSIGQDVYFDKENNPRFGYLELIIEKNLPQTVLEPCNGGNPTEPWCNYEYETAIEIFNVATGELIHQMDFGEFIHEYYRKTTTCTIGNYCYNTSFSKALKVYLKQGTYRVKLYALPGYERSGGSYISTPVGIDAKVRLRVPEIYMPNAPIYRDKEVGGVRIGTITDYNYSDELLAQRKYNYTSLEPANGETYSSGLLMYPIHFISLRSFFRFNLYPGFPSLYMRVYSKSPHPFYNVAKGSHIGYSQVEEVFVSNQDASKNFKTETKFENNPVISGSNPVIQIPISLTEIISQTNPNDLPKSWWDFYSQNSIYEIPTEYEDQNGSVIYQANYDNTGIKLQEVQNEYGYTTPLNALGSVGALKLYVGQVGSEKEVFARKVINAFQYYKHKVAKYVLKKSTTTNYTTAGAMTQVTDYFYNNHWYLSGTITHNSKKEKIATYNYYPFDVSGDPDNSNLINKNIVGVVVKSETTLNDKIASGSKIKYDPQGLPVSVSKYESEDLVDASFPAFSDKYRQTGSFTYYNGTSNLKEHLPTDNAPVTYLWGYNGTYMVAKVVGATYAQISALVDQTILDNPTNDAALRQELHKLRAAPSLSKAQVTTYTYNPLVGVTSVTSVNNKTMYYEYDSVNRLRLIKDYEGNILKRYTYQYKLK